MDRDDARFVAQALDSRISGDREALDRLRATSLIHLTAAAARVKALAADWPPAHIASAELRNIAALGSLAADEDPSPTLQIFVDKMRELLDEPVRPTGPRNRFERRAAAKINLSRRERLTGIRSPGLVH